jgi:GLPGLI family protein
MILKIRQLLQLLPLLASVPAMAQHEEPVLASVVYQFIHVNDTNNRANPVSTEMVLRLGQTNSKYYNASVENRMKKPPPKEKTEEKTTAVARPAKMIQGFAITMITSESFDMFFQLPGENKLVRKASLGSQDYIVEAPLPKIDWKIENETKTIGTYSCQKATGFFGGRLYTAWFAADLPFRNGPWKLSGLPGLILEAEDSRNEVSFLFKEISKGTGTERITAQAWRPVTIGEDAFVRARKAFDQNPVAVANSQLPDSGTPPEIFYMDANGNTVQGDEAKAAIKKEVALKNQNPLELKKN